ncbi:MAG: FAD-dependent monooxygenase, partial [Actinomycetota bacterium]|nr:FAD-dependent monooxygenase [Actinomycetota bacterium]
MSGEPVVIVGAGPTGALLGIELARRGADLRIIDKAPAPPTESRAGGVQSRTLELFARLGIVDELLSMGNRVTAINYYSGTKPMMRVDYRHLDGPYPFMLHVPQFETQRLLDDHLERLGVQVERGVELVHLSQHPAGVSVMAQEPTAARHEIAASYVVGCDGAHSAVRHQLQMSFDGQAYGGDWLGADVEVDWEYPESEMHVFTSPAGVLACLP